MKQIRYYLSLISVCFFLMAQAMPENCNNLYNFKRIDSSNGLSANNVKSIVRDKFGFVWIGTKNGLNQYDGTRVRRYEVFDPNYNCGNNNIGALYQDCDTILWIGTDRGIYLYNPKNEKIEYCNRKSPEGINAGNWVQRISGDNKGNIWALLPDMGVFLYTKETTKYFPIVEASQRKNIHPSELLVDRNGNTWLVTTGAGIFKYSAEDERFKKVRTLGYVDTDKILFGGLCEGDAGSLILGSSNGHLYSLDTETYQFEEIPFSMAGKIYFRSIEYQNGKIWVASHGGIYILNTNNGTESVLKEDPLNEFSISDDAIYTLYKDEEDGLWIGTMFGGVNYLPQRNFTFTNYRLSKTFQSSVVLGLAYDSNGKIWVGTENTGIMKLDPETGKLSDIPSLSEKGNIILSLWSYFGNLYSGISRSGLYRTDSKGYSEKVFPTANGTEDNNVYSYLIDSQGNEWVGPAFHLYQRKAGEKDFKMVQELGDQWVYTLFESSDGIIWIGTMGNGIWRYNPANGRYTSYIYDDSLNPENGLRSNSINSIMETHDGTVWISTDRGGLSRYNPKTNDFTTYDKKDGFPDDVVYDVLEDTSGNLWFGTNKGLVKFNPKTKEVDSFTRNDGMITDQFNYRSAIKAPDGKFYFGGVNGIVAFDPEKHTYAKRQLPIYFTGLTILNDREMLTSDSPISKNLLFTKEITLNYNQATFSVSIASPSYDNVGRRAFSYRLLPVNKQWTEAQNNIITFNNLATGSYNLEIKVTSGNYESVRVLSITVLPPWWRSIIAIIIYCLIFVSAVIAILLWYRKRQQQKLKEREKALQDSKDKEIYRSKVNFFTEIAHEIRTPLSLIDLPLEAIEEIGVDNPEIIKYLQVTKQNTRRLLQLTNQLLDFQKIESNRLTLKKERVYINDFVKEIADRFEPAINLTGKHLVRNFDDTKLYVSIDREALTKIVSNLLNNALKYGTYEIRMVFKVENDSFTIKVISDGEKISCAERERIFQPFYQTINAESNKDGVGIGLPLSTSLAKLLGGSLILEDTDAEHNVFTLTLPAESIEEKTDIPIENLDEYIIERESNQTKPRADIYSILLVDDNEDIVSFLADQLRKSFIVETALNGHDAMSKLKESQYDIVVTDIMMPIMNGLELCEKIKSDLEISHIPVLFITAKSDLDSKIKGLQYGAEAYVEKPFSIKYLTQLIKSILDNRRRERDTFAKNPFTTVSNMHVNKADKDFMERVRKVIEDNVSEEDFNVEAMCDLLAMSRSNLLRKIKTLFNLSPIELIRVIKLKKAAELIQEGTYRISDVCYMVGIASPSYFSKLFFKQFGVTPKDFEKQCKNLSKNEQTEQDSANSNE